MGANRPEGSDIAEYTDPGHNPMIPHTIVLSRAGVFKI
jgi:hypothetical protein